MVTSYSGQRPIPAFSGVLLALAILPSSGALAQDLQNLGFESGVSTQGVYVAPTYRLNDHFGVRLPLFYGSVDGSITGDLAFSGTLGSTSGGLMMDYRPFTSSAFANAWTLSAGVMAGGYSVTGSSEDIVIEGTEYAGTFDVDLAQESSVAPVLAAGYRQVFGNGLTLIAEAGVKVTQYDLNVTSVGDLGPLEDEFADDLAAANRALDDIPVTPFVTIGLGFQF